LDLTRCVNPSLDDNDFRMATLQDAINSVRKGDFQVVFDLKASFHHVRFHPSMCELMGFQVKQLDGVVRYYCFVFLVLGLRWMPRFLEADVYLSASEWNPDCVVYQQWLDSGSVERKDNCQVQVCSRYFEKGWSYGFRREILYS
jgi:hypothetical protein